MLSTCRDSVVREPISSRLRNRSRILWKSSEDTASVFLLFVSNLDWNESGKMKSWYLVCLKDEKINCVDFVVYEDFVGLATLNECKFYLPVLTCSFGRTLVSSLSFKASSKL